CLSPTAEQAAGHFHGATSALLHREQAAASSPMLHLLLLLFPMAPPSSSPSNNRSRPPWLPGVSLLLQAATAPAYYLLDEIPQRSSTTPFHGRSPSAPSCRPAPWRRPPQQQLPHGASSSQQDTSTDALLCYTPSSTCSTICHNRAAAKDTSLTMIELQPRHSPCVQEFSPKAMQPPDSPPPALSPPCTSCWRCCPQGVWENTAVESCSTKPSAASLCYRGEQTITDWANGTAVAARTAYCFLAHHIIALLSAQVVPLLPPSAQEFPAKVAAATTTTMVQTTSPRVMLFRMVSPL
ncbi:hypothetical protein U9M48_039836, partial [Paspalum notatum var. saurae]